MKAALIGCPGKSRFDSKPVAPSLLKVNSAATLYKKAVPNELYRARFFYLQLPRKERNWGNPEKHIRTSFNKKTPVNIGVFCLLSLLNDVRTCLVG
jgi:hypothetical protein